MPRFGSIGLDIGGTKTLLCLFNDKFQCKQSILFKTDAGRGKTHFDRLLMNAFRNLLKKANHMGIKVRATGVGCAGHIDYKKHALVTSPNIPFLSRYPLVQKLHNAGRGPVFLGNDVHMGLYGEHQLGAAKGMRHVLGIFVGTGIGGAMIIDGKLHLGASGCAGDIGHYMIQPFGPLGGSERMGVLDDVASRTAIAAAAAAYAAKQWAPNLLRMAGTDLGKIRSHVLSKAIRAGDKQIEELIRSRGRIIGIALSNLIDFVNPDMVVLGGGLVDDLPLLMGKEIAAGIREHSTAMALKKLRVVNTKLKEYAVAAGAAKMAWDTVNATGDPIA